MGYPAFCKKLGAKKQGHCYCKREETRLRLLLLNNNGLGFLHPVFFKKQVARFFQKAGCLIFSQTDPGFQNKNSGYRLTGRVYLQQVPTENHQGPAVTLLFKDKNQGH